MPPITMVQIKPTFQFAATGTTQKFRINNSGYITDFILTLPNFTNAVTGTLTIEDDEGNTLYTDAGAPRARNGTYVVTGIRVPVDEGFNFNLTISGVAGGTGGLAKVKAFLGD
jgi:hypothetical protein